MPETAGVGAKIPFPSGSLNKRQSQLYYGTVGLFIPSNFYDKKKTLRSATLVNYTNVHVIVAVFSLHEFCAIWESLCSCIEGSWRFLYRRTCALCWEVRNQPKSHRTAVRKDGNGRYKSCLSLGDARVNGGGVNMAGNARPLKMSPIDQNGQICQITTCISLLYTSSECSPSSSSCPLMMTVVHYPLSILCWNG